ncbi:molybdopterin synthase large subunit [Gammaproteobacteria bacterium]|nr:molybdopterin synthase large subunit [Gammaproteobacteria bacterium]
MQGATIHSWLNISIFEHDFDLGVEEHNLRTQDIDNNGALVAFQGMVRVFDQAIALKSLFIEHMPLVTEKEIGKIAILARKNWNISQCRIIHRVGMLAKNEKIMLIIVTAKHRSEAFNAAQFIMDYLKTAAPFWKREFFEDGSSIWVEPKTSDTIAAARW